jgi:hypothetical protein
VACLRDLALLAAQVAWVAAQQHGQLQQRNLGSVPDALLLACMGAGAV